MKWRTHHTLATSVLAFIALTISAHIANGLPVPLSAEGTDVLAQSNLQHVQLSLMLGQKPVSTSSLDRRVLDLGASAGDVLNTVMIHELPSGVIHPDLPSPQLHDVSQPTTSPPTAQPSGRLRQLKRPRWMKVQTKYGLTPDRLDVLQSEDRSSHQLLISALHVSLNAARANVRKAEASGDLDKMAAWRTKHNIDFAIRAAALARLGNEDAMTAERVAEAKFDELQASSKLIEADGSALPATSRPLPLLIRGGRHDRKYTAAMDGAPRVEFVSSHEGPPPRRPGKWYLRDADVRLSKSPAAKAKEAEAVVSLDAVKRKRARKNIKLREDRLQWMEQRTRAPAKPTSAGSSVETAASAQESSGDADHWSYHWFDAHVAASHPSQYSLSISPHPSQETGIHVVQHESQ